MDRNEVIEKLVTAAITGDTTEIEEMSSSFAKVVLALGPALKEICMGMSNGIADIKIDQIKKFEAAGFSRDQAISLVQDEWFAIARGLRANRK